MNPPTVRTTRTGNRRAGIRTRLTILYAATFFLATALVIVATFLYLRYSLGSHLSDAQVGELLHAASDPAAAHEAVRARFIRDRDDTLAAMLHWSLAALVLAAAAAAVTGWLLAGRALRPLRDITATAQRVAHTSAGHGGNLHERIALPGPDDEIKDLANTMDDMLARLEDAFAAQAQFAANASHELRTPLAINRALIEVALDNPAASTELRELGGQLLEVNQRHEQLIDGLLVLASSRTPATLIRCDLSTIAGAAAHTLRDTARDTGVTLTTEVEPAAALGDPLLLEQLVHNLTDNAIRYNTSGGTVTITTATTHDGAQLTVTNTGPTLSADELDRLFQPFQRGLPAAASDADRRGAGLGLSIVAAITGAHHGHIHAVPNPGGGLAITVTIPGPLAA